MPEAGPPSAAGITAAAAATAAADKDTADAAAEDGEAWFDAIEAWPTDADQPSTAADRDQPQAPGSTTAELRQAQTLAVDLYQAEFTEEEIAAHLGVSDPAATLDFDLKVWYMFVAS